MYTLLHMLFYRPKYLTHPPSPLHALWADSAFHYSRSISNPEPGPNGRIHDLQPGATSNYGSKTIVGLARNGGAWGDRLFNSTIVLRSRAPETCVEYNITLTKPIQDYNLANYLLELVLFFNSVDSPTSPCPLHTCTLVIHMHDFTNSIFSFYESSGQIPIHCSVINILTTHNMVTLSSSIWWVAFDGLWHQITFP